MATVYDRYGSRRNNHQREDSDAASSGRSSVSTRQKFRENFSDNQRSSQQTRYSYENRQRRSSDRQQEREIALEQYLLTCSKISYGLSTDDLREIVSHFAVDLGKSFPETWKIKEEDGRKEEGMVEGMAGKKWAKGFLARHKRFSLRTPENTSRRPRSR
ncbi:hypothetical protein DMENIID0001_149770 [Sergentomyia squamirostris]